MTKRYRYFGGEMWCPDFGQVLDCNDGEAPVITFHPPCFDETGAWKPEILLAMLQLAVVGQLVDTSLQYVGRTEGNGDDEGWLKGRDDTLYVTFHAPCFDGGFRWNPAVLLAMAALAMEMADLDRT